MFERIVDMQQSPEPAAYEAPALRVLGSVQELTQFGCDKRSNGSDGYTYMGQPIVCRSP
jgi:hypothetical protein